MFLAKALLSTVCGTGFKLMRPKISFLRIRSAESSKGGLLLLLVTSAVWGSRVNKISAADSKGPKYVETMDHPLLEPKDLKSETCLRCHSAKNEGKFVHTAVGMGCEACHQADSENSRTVMALSATGGVLCAKCHAINTKSVLHGPYQAGQCVICHDPHAAAFPAQTRASGNALCLSCHMLDQPEARVDAQTSTVSLFDGQVYDLAAWQSAPKIGARHPGNKMERTSSDPAAVKTPDKPASELRCLACHDPHASKGGHLLRSGVAGPGAIQCVSLGYPSEFKHLNVMPWKAPVRRGVLSGERL